MTTVPPEVFDTVFEIAQRNSSVISSDRLRDLLLQSQKYWMPHVDDIVAYAGEGRMRHTVAPLVENIDAWERVSSAREPDELYSQLGILRPKVLRGVEGILDNHDFRTESRLHVTEQLVPMGNGQLPALKTISKAAVMGNIALHIQRVKCKFVVLRSLFHNRNTTYNVTAYHWYNTSPINLSSMVLVNACESGPLALTGTVHYVIEIGLPDQREDIKTHNTRTFTKIVRKCHNATCANPLAFIHKLRACSGCRRVLYCSVECQRADWKNHKSSCSAKSY
jgi:hypothetical protein